MKPLNPIMAALALASVGTFSLRALANDGNAAAALTAAGGNAKVTVNVPAGVPIAVEDTNSITKLTDILAKNAPAKADAGARVADFLLLPDKEKKSFVASNVGTKELRSVALSWAAKQAPGDLAMLYFVVGVGPTPPAWVRNDDLLKKTVLPQREAEGRLRKALSRFADASAAQIKKGKEKDDATAFLNTALVDAKKIFDDPRTTAQVDESANQNNNTGVKPPDTTRGDGSGSRVNVASQQYTLENLYEDGAEVMNIAGPKDEHSRRISVKIYSTRAENGDIINEIGIFDITNKSDIFGQRFPMSGPNQSFILDDRTPGHKKYELKFGPQDENGDRPLTFGRPGAGPKAVIDTSVSKLLLKRANQAEAMSNIVNVGGEDFYVLPQGGARSTLMMFSKATIDGRNLGQARFLRPALYSEVGKRGAEGGNINVDPGANGGPELGEVGGKPFKLVYNKAIGAWEVKEGQGNKPERPKPEPTTDPATGGGGTTPTTPGGGGTTIPSGGKPIAELEMLLLKLPECKKLPGSVEKLDKALEKTFGLVTCNKTNKPEDLQVFVLVPSSVRPEQQLMYSANETAKNLLSGRFLGHYLVLQFEKQVHYLDLLKPTGTGFEVVGFVSEGTTGGDAKTGFKDMVTFMDALTNHMGVTGEDTKAFSEVPARMEKIGSFVYIQAKYRQDGAKKQLVVDGAAGGGGFEVWPNFKPSAGNDANGPSASQYASLSGPANAMDGSVGSVDAPLRDEIDLDKSMKGKAIKRQADIVVYKSVDPLGKIVPNQYFVMFRYDALDPKDPAKPDGEKEKKTFRQKQFEVFNSSNPLPSNFGAQGLVGATVIKDRVASGYRFVGGTNAERGVLAVFQEKQVSGENVKDKPGNCVGPIIWWGLKDRDAALKVCQEDAF